MRWHISICPRSPLEFFFDVKNDKFADAANIFSEFFKEPLFNEKSASREINIIENEYKKNISNEDKATYQIEKSFLSVPGSTISRFTTGNLKTLKVDNIVEKVKKFYNEQYTSNLMSLVVVSRLDLDK